MDGLVFSSWSIFWVNVFFSVNKEFNLSSTASIGIFKIEVIWSIYSLFNCKYFIAFIPVRASILRTPELEAISDFIIKDPIIPVLCTWVPPQSSIENLSLKEEDFASQTELKPINTTLTSFSYFSPKSAWAPIFFASSKSITLVSTIVSSKICLFTICSTFWISLVEIGLLLEKSNLNLSESFKDPLWLTWTPTTSFKAWCIKWVAEWLAAIDFLLFASTTNSTKSPLLIFPLLTIILWTIKPDIFLTFSIFASKFSLLIIPVSETWPPLSA